MKRSCSQESHKPYAECKIIWESVRVDVFWDNADILSLNNIVGYMEI